MYPPLVLLLLLLCEVIFCSGKQSNLIVGNQVLRDSGYASLSGHRVGVLTNPTGVFPDTLQNVVDVMATADKNKVHVVAVFAPEHGFRGEKQAETGDADFYVDDRTGLPVYSAYSLSVDELAAVMCRENITAVMVDVQDVGVRLYTFVWTMFGLMNATGTAVQTCDSGTGTGTGTGSFPRKFVVTDRPNPLGGDVIAGPLLDMDCCSSGYGRAPITHVHGMTIGELGLLFHRQTLGEVASAFEYEVVKMQGWRRADVWTRSYSDDRSSSNSLPWVPPSPNVPTPATALAYPSTCFLEATTVAEGRGTTTPFELFGAPFVPDNTALAALLDPHCGGRGAHCARAAYFQPTFSKYNGTAVPGVQWLKPQRMCGTGDVQFSHSRPFLDATVILRAFMTLAEPADAFQWDGSWFGHPGTELIDQYAGTPLYRQFLENASMTAADIDEYFQAGDVARFREERKPYLLYE